MAMDRLPRPQLEAFRRNVTRLREAAGLTQERLAERAGISPRYLQKVEAGWMGCSLAVLVRLRRALNASWDALLRGLR